MAGSARRCDETHGALRVFTYKEGALRSVAHDLVLLVQRWSIESDERLSRVDVSISADSLRVLGTVEGERITPLSTADNAKIERIITRDVLAAERHPTIRFTGSLSRTAGVCVAQGELTLRGASRPLTISATLEDRVWRMQYKLTQSDYGIKPFTAMLGTLRVKDVVTVALEIPANNASWLSLA